MLAAAALGATVSTCSPDFGVRGVLDRFGQIVPKVLFAADGYFYNGKQIDSLEKVREIASGLPDLKRVVVASYVGDRPDLSRVPGAQSLEDFVGEGAGGEIRFEQLPFDHPLYILFSSGTTGVPKCIVHGAGGALLKHLCEQQLHCDIKPGDRLFYFTTLGWMMWNWLASGLASARRSCSTTARPSSKRAGSCSTTPMPRGRPTSALRRSSSTRSPRPASSRRGPTGSSICVPCSRPGHRSLPRASISCTARSSATCAFPRFREDRHLRVLRARQSHPAGVAW